MLSFYISFVLFLSLALSQSVVPVDEDYLFVYLHNRGGE